MMVDRLSISHISNSITGCSLLNILCLPLSFDEESLKHDLTSRSVSYSGAVALITSKRTNYFTWGRKEPHDLKLSYDLDWDRNLLSEVSLEGLPSWSFLMGRSVVSTCLYSRGEKPDSLVGIKCQLSGGERPFVWIGTGGSDGLFPDEEIWMGVNVDPRNVQELISYTAQVDRSDRKIKGSPPPNG